MRIILFTRDDALKVRLLANNTIQSASSTSIDWGNTNIQCWYSWPLLSIACTYDESRLYTYHQCTVSNMQCHPWRNGYSVRLWGERTRFKPWRGQHFFYTFSFFQSYFVGTICQFQHGILCQFHTLVLTFWYWLSKRAQNNVGSLVKIVSWVDPLNTLIKYWPVACITMSTYIQLLHRDLCTGKCIHVQGSSFTLCCLFIPYHQTSPPGFCTLQWSATRGRSLSHVLYTLTVYVWYG